MHPTTRDLLPARRRCRGVALIMVLCALFMITLIVFGLARRVDDELLLASRDDHALEAKALAFTGLQIALHPLSSVKTEALHRNVDARHRYAARILGEGGRLNLNWLLAGEDQRKIGILKQYLENAGLNFQEQEILTDCLLDWVKPGTTTHLNGSRVGLDGQPVPGRPFQDLTEVARVVGSEPLTRVSNWQNDFTLLTKGPVDVQWASEDVLAALPGVGQSRARGFVRQRRGPDGLDGTADDFILADTNNPQIIPQLLGLSQDLFQSIQDLVTTADTTVRIVSVGQAQDVTHTFEVVVRKEGLQPQILSWKEF